MIWALIAAILAVVIGGGGAVYAAQDALPGEALYPVKEMVEDAQLLMADPVEEVQLHMDFAERRLAEAQQLMAQGQVDLALEAMVQAEAHWQAALAMAEQVRGQRADAWPEVMAQAERLAQQMQMLNTLKEQARFTVKAQAQQGMAQADTAHTQVHERLAEVEARLAEVQTKMQAVLGEPMALDQAMPHNEHEQAHDVKDHGQDAMPLTPAEAMDAGHEAHDAAEAMAEDAHEQNHHDAQKVMDLATETTEQLESAADEVMQTEAMSQTQDQMTDATTQSPDATQDVMDAMQDSQDNQDSQDSMGSLMPIPTGTVTPNPHDDHDGSSHTRP
ncbi:MAG: hypothetical protein GXO54_01480 [Chloroflexi bacterium]|nr:hypothetical protein [Chloroflexota bacterium]